MWASKATAWVSAGVLLLLIGYHEYVWFAAFQEPSVFRHPHADGQYWAECNSPSCYRYYSSKTAPYLIESFPEVDFETGEFYSGSIAIDESDPSRTLFFVFKPAANRTIDDEIVIWLNGGPGCSSLYGFASENGPISFQTEGAADSKHKRNSFAWSDVANMIWVEQPTNTGFSQGPVEPFNEKDLGKDFANFFERWQRLFGVKNYKIYLTGESFAGRYIPHIANEMLDRNDKTFFDLRGAIMYSPAISDRKLESLVPRYPFVLARNDILQLNQTTVDELSNIHAKCGYGDYMSRYLQYPPPGIQPADSVDRMTECDIIVPYIHAVREANPCYNTYHITDVCPSKYEQNDLWLEEYFNREDVKRALHAPMDREWSVCSREVTVDSEKRAGGPIQHFLPRLIENTSRVLIASGGLDGIILSNGTLLAIQNMTWHGKLGFEEKPSTDFIVPADALGPEEVKGMQHHERGLHWIGTYESGHEQPMYAPRAALRQLQWLRGEIEVL